MTQPLILIPSRLASTRLPRKPLAMIGDAPMIVQVWRRAQEANLAPVAVACDSVEIKEAIKKEGGISILTDPDLPSGSDRIWQALQQYDTSQKHDVIINLQGDMPTLDPSVIAAVLKPLENPAVDIATLVAKIHTEEERVNPAVVKVVLSGEQRVVSGEASRPSEPSAREAAPHVSDSMSRSGGNYRSLYFSRALIPTGEGPHYHHIGIYAYRRSALEKFVSLPPSPLEIREKLEQLRALENNMRIDVAVVNTVPLGVDTPEQLEMARKVLNR